METERELTRLLIEYDELEAAWPKGGHVLVRAEIGRQVADALSRIADLENDIIATPAKMTAGPHETSWTRPWRPWKRLRARRGVRAASRATRRCRRMASYYRPRQGQTKIPLTGARLRQA